MDTIPENIPTKQCSKCKQYLPATPVYFYPKYKGTFDFHAACRSCYNAARRKKPLPEPVPEGYKRCTKCKQILLSSGFGKDRYACKTCVNASRVRYYWENQEEERKKRIQYHQDHKEEENRKRFEYSQRHKEHEIARHLQYYHTDHYRKLHRTQAHRRRALKRNAPGSFTAEQFQKQIERQKHRCYYCKQHHTEKGFVWHADHVVPLSRGGSNDISNVVAACPTCNLKKANKLLHEWGEGGRLL